MTHDPMCPTYGRAAGGGVWGAIDCRCGFISSARSEEQERILAALRAELPSLSCYEPSRMIGSPCSCAAGLLRAIEIVEATQ